MTLGHVPELHTDNHYKRAVAMLVDARLLGKILQLQVHRSSNRRINYRIWIMKEKEVGSGFMIGGQIRSAKVYEQDEVVARFKSVPKKGETGPKNWTSHITYDEAMEMVRRHRNRLKSPCNKRNKLK